MDDMKVFAKDDGKLKGLMETVKNFNNDIGKTFRLNKCENATFRSGRLMKSTMIMFELQ